MGEREITRGSDVDKLQQLQPLHIKRSKIQIKNTIMSMMA